MAFDRLATGESFRKAQSSRLAGKMADRREALDARRETFGELSSLALELLNGVGHNPIAGHTTASTLHSKHYPPTYRLPMAQLLGALTQDEDPPGFESLASFHGGTNFLQMATSGGRKLLA